MYDNQLQTAAGPRVRDLINEALKARDRMLAVRETAVPMDRARKVQARKDAVRMLVAAKTAGPTVAAPRARDLINAAL